MLGPSAGGPAFASDSSAANRVEPVPGKSVLIFSHTAGYRHDSIETGVAAMAEMVRSKGMHPVASEDVRLFSTGKLEPYRAIIFVNTTTRSKDPATDWMVGDAATHFRAWLASGGAVIGIHAASDQQYHQPWFGRMMGGWFLRHPPGTQSGRLTVADPSHPATQMLPAAFDHIDEWYAFKNFDPSVRLLLTLDPQSIGQPAGPHWPISWSKEYEGGRIFYTALGHRAETFSEQLFLKHVSGGFDWAVGAPR